MTILCLSEVSATDLQVFAEIAAAGRAAATVRPALMTADHPVEGVADAMPVASRTEGLA